MKIRSKTMFFKNQSEMRCGSLWVYFSVMIVKTSIWSFDLKFQKPWLMLMTSSISILMGAIKKLSRGTIINWLEHILFWPSIWRPHTKIQMSTAINVTELYRKVRKLTEGQNFSRGTIFRFLIKTLHFSSLITQCGVTETFTSLLMFIGWWITWYGQKHFRALYCYNNLFWNHRILNELCTSFERAQSKDFKNIYPMKI